MFLLVVVCVGNAFLVALSTYPPPYVPTPAQMHGKPFTVPFAHNKQITAVTTIRKGDKLILISASKTRAWTDKNVKSIHDLGSTSVEKGSRMFSK